MELFVKVAASLVVATLVQAVIIAQFRRLKQHSVSHIPERRQVDVSLTYADYYFIKALIRYKQINK